MAYSWGLGPYQVSEVKESQAEAAGWMVIPFSESKERRGGGEDSGGAASSSGRECFVSTDCMFSLHLYP